MAVKLDSVATWQFLTVLLIMKEYINMYVYDSLISNQTERDGVHKFSFALIKTNQSY